MIYEINRVDVVLMQTLETNEANNAAFGLTITEIMESMVNVGYTKTRMTVYRHLQLLVEHGYVAKGVMSDHADTFYILENGHKFLKGEF